jgi:hypothetical protein
MLLRFYEAEHPRAVLVAWDTLDAPTYRHEAFEVYQSGREFDRALLEQLDALPEFVAACGFANAKAAGYEADDFLAAAAAAEERRKGTALVASGDRDTFQLASDATTILYPVRAGEIARIGPAEVRERYGVEPAQVPDFIALRGDPSDRLPGVPGVGPQGAAGVLRTYGSLEARSRLGDLRRSLTDCDCSVRSPPWTARRRCRGYAINVQAGRERRRLPAIGSLRNSPIGSASSPRVTNERNRGGARRPHGYRWIKMRWVRRVFRFVPKERIGAGRVGRFDSLSVS